MRTLQVMSDVRLIIVQIRNSTIQVQKDIRLTVVNTENRTIIA